MATKNFVVQNGLQVGPLTISATTGDITTTGNVTLSGSGSLGVSQIAKNDSSITINDSGTGSTVVINIDGTTETTIDAAGIKLPSGDAFYINGTSVLNATTLGSGVTASSLTSVGTLGSLTVTGNVTAGNLSGTNIVGTLTTASQTNITAVGTIATGTWNATTIATSKGGTGLTSFTSGGALYATSTSALTTGTLPVASGGTGVTTSTGTGSVVLSASPTFTGTISAAELTLSGNLTVNGTTTTINSTTLAVDDKNIVLGDVTTPTDLTADGGGITLKGATDKTLNWVDATDAWTSSEHINLASGKAYYINGTSVLSASTLGSGVTASSLTSVGTIATGVWQGSSIATTYTAAKVTDVQAGTGVGVSATTGSITVSIGQAVGTGNSPTFAGITVPSITKSGTTGSGDIGQSNNTFATVYATTFSGVSTTAKYADLAENYSADAEYAPGTVLHFGGDAEVTQCNEDMCQRVAGVVTTNPAHLMNSELQGTKAAIALQGRVPCRVVGQVRKGDMMVSAGNGAARAEANPKIGSVIGKALENFDGQEGVIEVVVGRV